MVDHLRRRRSCQGTPHVTRSRAWSPIATAPLVPPRRAPDLTSMPSDGAGAPQLRVQRESRISPHDPLTRGCRGPQRCARACFVQVASISAWPSRGVYESAILKVDRCAQRPVKDGARSFHKRLKETMANKGKAMVVRTRTTDTELDSLFRLVERLVRFDKRRFDIDRSRNPVDRRIVVGKNPRAVVGLGLPAPRSAW